MKNILFLFLTFLFLNNLLAQGEVAREIGDLIKKGNLDQAEEKVNYYLKQDPKNVDAIMMKGNILLNKNPNMQGDIVIAVNEDESVYESSIGYMSGHENVIVPKDLAQQVADIWKQAIAIDDTRKDIHYGICQVYSIALLPDELISYLPILKRVITDDDKLPYSMCNYARNMKNRNDFNNAIKIYKAVYALYPEESGLLSDIAGEYYQHGDIDSAQYYISVALKKSNLDMISYGNAFFILSVYGQYHKALDAIKIQSKLAKDTEFLLYQGLLEYYENQSNWKKTIQMYLKNAKDKAKITLAEYLVSENYQASMEDYHKLIDLKVNDGYKIIIHHKFINLEPNKFLPSFNYAELLTYSKVYSKAVKEYDKLEKSNLLSDKFDKEKVAFYHGWALWDLGKKKESIYQWSQLFKSDNFYYKSAAAYFTGKYCLDNGETKKAKEYFGMVSSDASKSKYATYCWNLLKNL